MIRWYRYSIGIALGILSCNGYKNYTSKKIHPYVYSDSLCQFDQTITPEEKHIDAKYFDSILKGRDQVLLKENDTFSSKIWKKYKGGYTNKQTNKQTNIGKWLSYRKNGSLLRKIFKQDQGNTKIGKSTEYDSLGRVTAVINHRDTLHYPICFQEAIAIVEGVLKPTDSIIHIRRERITKTDEPKQYREYTHKLRHVKMAKDTLYLWRVTVDDLIVLKGESDTKAPGTWSYIIEAGVGHIIDKKAVKFNTNHTF